MTSSGIYKNNIDDYLFEEDDNEGQGKAESDNTIAATDEVEVDTENEENNVYTPDNPMSDAYDTLDAEGNKVYQGLFSFEDAMNSISNWDPEDDAGIAQKNLMNLEYLQSGMDNLHAKDMAWTNSAIATSQMFNAANLELRNQSQTMYDDFKYNAMTNGLEYELQNKFANNEANRDLTQIAVQGNTDQNMARLQGDIALEMEEERGYQQRENLIEQGFQERETLADQGYQERETLKEQGIQDVNRLNAASLADEYRAKATGKETRKNIREQNIADVTMAETQSQNRLDEIQEQGSQERLGLQEQGAQGRLGIREQSVADINLENARGVQERKGQVVAGDQDIRRINAQSLAGEYQARVAGDEDRQTIREQNIADIMLEETSAQNQLDQIKAGSDANLASIAQSGLQNRLGVMEQNIADMNMARTTGAQTRETLAAQGDTDIRKLDAKARADVYVTKAAGKQSRENIKEQNKQMLRILYISYMVDIARAKSATIKGILASSKYREIFPMVRLSKIRRSDEYWSIDYEFAGIDTSGEEAFTIACGGLKGAITSKRSQLVLIDDPIKSAVSINNPDIRREMETTWTNVIAPTMFQGARAICLGTRFHFDDLHATLFVPKNNWKQVVQQAIITSEDGKQRSYWPEFWSMKYL